MGGWKGGSMPFFFFSDQTREKKVPIFLLLLHCLFSFSGVRKRRKHAEVVVALALGCGGGHEAEEDGPRLRRRPAEKLPDAACRRRRIPPPPPHLRVPLFFPLAGTGAGGVSMPPLLLLKTEHGRLERPGRPSRGWRRRRRRRTRASRARVRYSYRGPSSTKGGRSWSSRAGSRSAPTSLW